MGLFTRGSMLRNSSGAIRTRLRSIGCLAWYSASGPTDTKVADAGVGSISDILGISPALTQGTAINKPLYKTSGFGTKSVPYLLFDGSDDSLATTAFGSPIAQPYTVIAAAQRTVLDGSNRSILDGVGAVNRGTLYSLLTTGNMALYAGTGPLNSGQAAGSDPFIVTGIFNGASSETFFNGTAGATGNAGAASLGGFCIGAYYDASINFWVGPIAELMVFQGALSTADRQWVEQFLAARCGITVALAGDGFESGSYASWWTNDYDTATNYTPTTAAVLYDTAVKHSGSYSAHYHIVGTAGGGLDEQEPFKLSLENPKFSSLLSGAEIFVEFWMYITTGYPWPASSQKTFRLGYDDGGGGTTNFTVGLLIQGANSNLQLRCFNWSGTRDVHTEVAEATATNTWIKFGVYAKINDVGVANGIASLYRNDTRIIHITNAEHRGASQTGVLFNYFWIGGNYSNSGSAPANDGEIYYDDIKVYDRLPY